LNFNTIELSPQNTKHHFVKNNNHLSYADWIEEMLISDELIIKFNDILKESKFISFFWEVKSVVLKELDQPFEFVLVESKTLNRISSDDSSFSKYFKDNISVVNFSNLRKDAELIVPTPFSNETQYAHIARFVRTAETSQIIDFWRRVIESYQKKISDKPTWLSTAGLGVHWLHVRIDSRPKYYHHKEYKKK